MIKGLVWGNNSQSITADHTLGTYGELILSSTDDYQTGVSFTLSIGMSGVLPSPLNDSDTYFAIRIDATHIAVASSYSNANLGIGIHLSDDGTPPFNITSTGQLQTAQIESHPGNIIACRTLHRRLFLFSENYTEVWEIAGIGTILPFRRNNSLLMEYGAAAIGSISVGFDVLFFLAQDRDGLGSIMMVQGTQAMPVSTRALDYQLAQYAANQAISDVRGFFVKENGLIFYRMNFTAANHTFVYNLSQSVPDNDATKFWHEEETLNGNRHPAQTHGFLNGLNYVGDYLLPKVYQLNNSTYTNNGETIKRSRITRALCPPGYQRLRVDRLQFDLLQGQYVKGISNLNYPTTVNPTPNLSLRISKDGGQTYGYEIQAPLGTVGDRTFRTVFRKLGTIPRGQPWVIRVDFYFPYPLVVLGAAWAVSELPE